MIHYEALRKKLIQRRIDMEMTQADVATRIGIKISAFNSLETGRRPNPTTVTLHAWCRALEAHLTVDAEFYHDDWSLR